MPKFEALRKLLPNERTLDGRTRVAQSLIDEWKNCPFQFYAERVAPLPGGTGLRPALDEEPLWVGKVFGAGLEGWFRSGWRDRRYDGDAALAALNASAEAERAAAGFEDTFEKWKSSATALLESYIAKAGPDDPHLFQIVELNGEPLIEREFEFDLGDGLAYSSRPDLVVIRTSDEVVCALDHKTTSRPDLSRSGLRRRPQLTGEQLAVEQVTGGKRAGMLVNLVHKKPTKGTPLRTLEVVDRVGARLELFVQHTKQTLVEIDRHLEEYWDRCQRMPEALAARLTFDDEPGEEACRRYNRECRFFLQCVKGEGVVEWHRDDSRPRYEATAGAPVPVATESDTPSA